jgi:hypothetical protein
VEPGEIRDAAHHLCEERLIPDGISPPHPASAHDASDEIYRKAINDAGLEVSGRQLVNALIAMRNWDMKSPWQPHPMPDEVVAWLREVDAFADTLS